MISAFEMANGSPDKNSNYILLAGKWMATFAEELFFFDSCIQLLNVSQELLDSTFIIVIGGSFNCHRRS